MCERLPHTRGPHRHPDEAVYPGRQKSAVEVWVVGGRRKNVALNHKWPSFTIVQLLQWMFLSKLLSIWMGNGERMKGGERVTLSQWTTQFRAFIPMWMTELMQIAAEWMRIARPGLFDLFKQAGWTWDFYFLGAFIQAPLQQKWSPAHICHYCHVFLSSNATTWKQWNWFDCPAHKKKKCLLKEIEAFPRKSCCTTKCYLDVQFNIHYYYC